MAYKIALIWGIVVAIGVVVFMANNLIVALTMAPGFLSAEQALAILALIVGWFFFCTIFGLFSREGVRRA